MSSKISRRGGARPGSGRPRGSGKSGEPTKVIRVPEGAKAAVLDFVAVYNERKHARKDEAQSAVPSYPDDALFPLQNAPHFELPLYAHAVPAGLPAAAESDVDRRLDLNEFLIRNPAATFYFKVKGDSMNRTSLQEGAIAAVDCSRLPQNGDIVLAAIDGDFTVKRYVRVARSFELQPDSSNTAHQAIKPKVGQTVEIRGVIVGTIQKFH